MLSRRGATSIATATGVKALCRNCDKTFSHVLLGGVTSKVCMVSDTRLYRIGEHNLPFYVVFVDYENL